MEKTIENLFQINLTTLIALALGLGLGIGGVQPKKINDNCIYYDETLYCKTEIIKK